MSLPYVESHINQLIFRLFLQITKVKKPITDYLTIAVNMDIDDEQYFFLTSRYSPTCA